MAEQVVCKLVFVCVEAIILCFISVVYLILQLISLVNNNIDV